MWLVSRIRSMHGWSSGKKILLCLYEIAPTVATFPLLGSLGGDGTVPPTQDGEPKAESEYIGDGIVIHIQDLGQ